MTPDDQRAREAQEFAPPPIPEVRDLPSGWWIIPGLAVLVVLFAIFAMVKVVFAAPLPWLASDGSTREWEGDVLIVCTPSAPGWSPRCQDWTLEGMRGDKGGADAAEPVSLLGWRESLAPPAYASQSLAGAPPYTGATPGGRNRCPWNHQVPIGTVWCVPESLPPAVPLPAAAGLLLAAVAALALVRRARA